MTLTLMENLSEDNCVNKNVATVLSVEGRFKDDTSLIDPVFLIQGNTTSIAACNYLYLSDVNRYYFIVEIVSVANNLIEIYAHEDVLMTYKDAILDNEAVIARQEKVFNRKLPDPLFRTYQDSQTITKKFSGNGLSDYVYIMIAAGIREKATE